MHNGIGDESGKMALRHEAVVRGDDNGIELSGEVKAVVVKVGPGVGAGLVEDLEFGAISEEVVARFAEMEVEVMDGVELGRVSF